MFAHALHIRPWEMTELPVPQFRLLVAWLEDFNRTDDPEA